MQPCCATVRQTLAYRQTCFEQARKKPSDKLGESANLRHAQGEKNVRPLPVFKSNALAKKFPYPYMLLPPNLLAFEIWNQYTVSALKVRIPSPSVKIQCVL